MLTVEPLTSKIAKKVESGVTCDYVKISNGKDFCIMTQKYVDHFMEKIKNFKVYEDDIWIVTYPKCGTTWTQEMLRLLCSDFDYEEASKVELFDVFPFLEWNAIINNMEKDWVALCENAPRPRKIKSHLPLFLLPNELWTVKPKIIYVARNPKDVAISWYHHHYHLHCCKVTKDEFLDAYVTDQMLYNPVNEHILEFWKVRNEPHVLFTFYEDMKRDLASVVRKTAEFLGKSITDEQVEKLIDHLSFAKIKENPNVNKDREIEILKRTIGEEYNREEFSFVRKGKVGGYKEELNEEQMKRLEKYSNHPDFEKFGFAHKYT